MEYTLDTAYLHNRPFCIYMRVVSTLRFTRTKGRVMADSGLNGR